MIQIAAYRKSFETVEKTKQVVMLYDTAISSLYQAKTAIQANDFQERYNNLERAFLIMSGLKNCLDHISAPELSGTLHDWYSSIEMKILGINASNSIDECETCILHLRTMREAWMSVDVATTNEQEAQAAAISGHTETNEDMDAPSTSHNNSDSILAAAAYSGTLSLSA